MKILEKIIAIIAVLSLAACMLFSCGDGSEGGGSEVGGGSGEQSGNEGGSGNEGESGGGEQSGRSEYTVSVKDQNDLPISGASIVIMKDGSFVATVVTGADGQAKKELDDGNYTAMLMGSSAFTATVTETVFTDKVASFRVETKEAEKTETYTIIVLDQNGDAVVGASVQACLEACRSLPNTDSEGKSSGELPAITDGEYKAQLVALPEGYSVEDMKAYYTFGENKTATIVVTKN